MKFYDMVAWYLLGLGLFCVGMSMYLAHDSTISLLFSAISAVACIVSAVLFTRELFR